jgi:prevent-host-death family protein
MGLSIMQARAKFADTVNRVQYTGERIVLERHGKGVAAVIPIEDLELLERIEDERDAKAAQRALSAIEAGKEATVPWSEVRAKMVRNEASQRKRRA